MTPDTIITAIEILISAIIFTTGFLSVRIHGERLRLLEGRDSAENRLADADAEGKPVLQLKPPSTGEFDLGRVGAMLLIGNFGFLIAILLLEIYYGLQASWAPRWPAEPQFWLFVVVDAVGLVLVVIASLDWCIVRRNLSRDLAKRPWTLFGEARSAIMEAVGSPRTQREPYFVEAEAKLLQLTLLGYRSWIAPIKLTARLEWLRYGAGHSIDTGTLEKLVALLPNEPAARLGLAHTLTCAWVTSPRIYEDALPRARQHILQAIDSIRGRSLPKEVIAAAQEALGDTYLAEHDWDMAITAYRDGIYPAGTIPVGHHCLRCQLKKALAILGQQAGGAQVDAGAVHDARRVFKDHSDLIVKQGHSTVEEAPAGLECGTAIAELLVYNPTVAYRTIDGAREKKSSENHGHGSRMECLHIELCRIAVLLHMDKPQYVPVDHQELLDKVGAIQGDLRKANEEIRDETELLPMALFFVSLALQAALLDRLGKGEEADEARQAIRVLNSDLHLAGQTEPLEPLNLLIAAWCALEIYGQGFFQSLGDRRNRVGPFFLEPEHDPTTSFYDYVFMSYHKIEEQARSTTARQRRLHLSSLLDAITDRLCQRLSRYTD